MLKKVMITNVSKVRSHQVERVRECVGQTFDVVKEDKTNIPYLINDGETGIWLYEDEVTEVIEPKLLNSMNFEGITKEMNETYKRKNADYGNSFGKQFEEFGMISSVVRLTDKLERLKSLTIGKNQQQVNNESIEDTLLDMANYAIMTVMELRK